MKKFENMKIVLVGNYPEGSCLGDSYRGWKLSVGNSPDGNYRGGICPGGNYLETFTQGELP